MTAEQEPVPVTQAGMNAAREFFSSWPSVTVPDYLEPALAEAFDRHRLAAQDADGRGGERIERARDLAKTIMAIVSREWRESELIGVAMQALSATPTTEATLSADDALPGAAAIARAAKAIRTYVAEHTNDQGLFNVNNHDDELARVAIEAALASTPEKEGGR